jgi:hypothetical protein
MDGNCHCGAVHWRFNGTPESATTCNCSVCRRWGALWAYGFFDEAITVTGATQIYMWDRKSIEFHFCALCACIVSWRAATSGADGRRFGAINLRLVSDPAAVQAIPLVHHVTEIKGDLPPDGMCVANVWA